MACECCGHYGCEMDLQRFIRWNRSDLTDYDLELLGRIVAHLSGERGRAFVHPSSGVRQGR